MDLDWLLPDPPNALLSFFPEEAKLIAYFISAWNHVEDRLSMLLGIITTPSNGVATIMLHRIQSSRAKLKTMSAAFQRVVPAGAYLTKLLNALDDADKLLTLRDRYAHAVYGWHEAASNPNKRLVIHARGDREERPLPLHDLQYQVRRMNSFSVYVAALVAEAAQQTPPLAPGASDGSQNADPK